MEAFAEQLLGDYDSMLALDEGVIHPRAKKSSTTLRDICASLIEVKHESSEEETCTICLSEFEAGEVLVKPTSCRHTFHRHCLEHWVESDLNKRGKCSCPVCRQEIVAVS